MNMSKSVYYMIGLKDSVYTLEGWQRLKGDKPQGQHLVTGK